MDSPIVCLLPVNFLEILEVDYFAIKKRTEWSGSINSAPASLSLHFLYHPLWFSTPRVRKKRIKRDVSPGKSSVQNGFQWNKNSLILYILFTSYFFRYVTWQATKQKKHLFCFTSSFYYFREAFKFLFFSKTVNVFSNLISSFMNGNIGFFENEQQLS